MHPQYSSELSHKLLEEARAWLGTPYLKDGASFSGVDCGNFLLALLSRAGAYRFSESVEKTAKLLWTRPDGLDEAIAHVRRNLEPHFVAKGGAPVAPGRFLLLTPLKRLDRTVHLALCCGSDKSRPYIIHAEKPRGVVLDQLPRAYRVLDCLSLHYYG